MSQTNVIYPNGTSVSLAQYSITCPFCHTQIIPDYLCVDNDKIFARCPNQRCGKHFILAFDGVGFTVVEPNSCPMNKEFSEIINSISSEFSKIYNQAYHAEQMQLDHICGVGYRKALEFLIKDYLISKETDENVVENIKKKFLSSCIQENVQNENIKNVAKRAVWLGNDETHYVRIWENKDVQYLKKLIDLTVRWIENEIETVQVLQDMI